MKFKFKVKLAKIQKRKEGKLPRGQEVKSLDMLLQPRGNLEWEQVA